MRTQAAQAASAIRATLKINSISATVKSKTFSMGSSVTVNVTDQPPWVIDAMHRDLDKYEYGTFDAMTDCQGLKNQAFDGPQVKYLIINNSVSDEKKANIWLLIRANYAGFEDAPEDYSKAWEFHHETMGCTGDMMISRLLDDPTSWEKPRIRQEQ